MWERYCSGVSAIVFVVDSSIPLPADSEHGESQLTGEVEERRPASEAWFIAAEELHALLQRPALAGLPLLVLATKNDISHHANVQQVIATLYVISLPQKTGRPQGP